MIPELPVTEPYAFVSVVKTETIPLEFEESAMYADQEYNNELVTILCAIVSKEREEEILGETLIHSSYYCDGRFVRYEDIADVRRARKKGVEKANAGYAGKAL